MNSNAHYWLIHKASVFRLLLTLPPRRWQFIQLLHETDPCMVHSEWETISCSSRTLTTWAARQPDTWPSVSIKYHSFQPLTGFPSCRCNDCILPYTRHRKLSIKESMKIGTSEISIDSLSLVRDQWPSTHAATICACLVSTAKQKQYN